MEKVLGKDHFLSSEEVKGNRKWYNPLTWFDAPTSDFLEITYQTSLTGMSVAEIDDQMRSEQLDQVFGLIAMNAVSQSTPSISTFRSKAVNQGMARTWNEINPRKALPKQSAVAKKVEEKTDKNSLGGPGYLQTFAESAGNAANTFISIEKLNRAC